MSPFDFLNAINYTKEDLMLDPDNEKKYAAFLVNRGLSYFNDTALLANEMNRYHQLDHKLQFDFLRGIVRKRKRFSKWNKAQQEGKIEAIKEYYGYSTEKAVSVADLISDEQYERLTRVLRKGGKTP